MTAVETFHELHRRGVLLSTFLGQLELDAPEGVMTSALIEAVKANKTALIALVERPWHPCSTCGRFAFPRMTGCFWCRVGS
jgi:hypothetical protein